MLKPVATGISRLWNEIKTAFFLRSHMSNQDSKFMKADLPFQFIPDFFFLVTTTFRDHVLQIHPAHEPRNSRHVIIWTKKDYPRQNIEGLKQ